MLQVRGGLRGSATRGVIHCLPRARAGCLLSAAFHVHVALWFQDLTLTSSITTTHPARPPARPPPRARTRSFNGRSNVDLKDKWRNLERKRLKELGS